MKSIDSKHQVKDAKKLFRKLGACSSTQYYILNREFGHQREVEVRAAEPLAGGIMRQGYQCGMLWGSALAVGAESYRRSKDPDKAVGMAISTTQHVMKSFVGRTKAVDCFDITECDWTNKVAMIKFMITGKFLSCFTLAENWAPEMIEAAYEGFSAQSGELPLPAISCASEVVRKMGGRPEEIASVAGFAGGIGLSGNGCGALGAAIWLNSLKWSRENPGKSSYDNPDAKRTLDTFMKFTNFKVTCHEITGKQFTSIADHTEFMKNGGCKEVISALAT